MVHTSPDMSDGMMETILHRYECRCALRTKCLKATGLHHTCFLVTLFCQLNCKDSCCLPLSTLVLLSILLCVVIPIGLFKLFPSLDVCLLPNSVMINNTIKSHTKKKNMRSWSSGLSSKCMWKAASTWPRWWWSSNSAKLSLESSARPWKPLYKWSPDRTYTGHSH